MVVTSVVLTKRWVGFLSCQAHRSRVSIAGTYELHHGGEVEVKSIKGDAI